MIEAIAAERAPPREASNKGRGELNLKDMSASHWNILQKAAEKEWNAWTKY